MRLMPDNWGDVLLPHGPLLELIVRPTIVYFFLLACLRLFARRQVSRFGLSDILILFLLATTVRHGLTGRYLGVGDALIVASTILLWDWLLNMLSYHSRVIRWLVRGRAILVVRAGEIVEDAAHRERLSRDDIMEKLREHGVAELSGVREAYVEPDGKFSVIRKGGG